MLKFENYTPENLKKYAPYIKNCPYNVNDVSVGSFFMWYGGVNLKFAVHNGAFISVQDICGEPSFSYPFEVEHFVYLRQKFGLHRAERRTTCR